MSQEQCYFDSLPPESRPLYREVVSRVGAEWAELPQNPDAPVGDHADHLHWAGHLADAGVLEKRHINFYRDNGTFNGCRVEYRRSAPSDSFGQQELL